MALALLLVASITFTIDRQVPMIVAELVKKEFHLSDSQLGLFTGLSYSVSYAVVGLLIGPVIDRRNRSRLLALMLFLWSGLTAVAGFVGSFVQLLAARFAVGAAEAGGSPTMMSILVDNFPPHRRGIAIGLFKMGLPIGFFTAAVLCGHVASLYGWRAAFLVAGLPGMLLALAIMRWLPEPRRGAMDEPGTRSEPMPLAEVIRVIVRAPGVGFIALGFIFYNFGNAGVQAFIVPFMQRAHGLTLVKASGYFGLAAGIGGISPLVAGLINDRVMRRGIAWSPFLAAGMVLITTVAGLVMAITNADPLMVAALILWQLLLTGMTTVVYSVLLTLTPPGMRGTLVSWLLVGSIPISIGLGPVVTGGLSDLFQSLRIAIIIMICVNMFGLLGFTLATRQLRRQA
jgi:predicted MFS family arabinose efflux permease